MYDHQIKEQYQHQHHHVLVSFLSSCPLFSSGTKVSSLFSSNRLSYQYHYSCLIMPKLIENDCKKKKHKITWINSILKPRKMYSKMAPSLANLITFLANLITFCHDNYMILIQFLMMSHLMDYISVSTF